MSPSLGYLPSMRSLRRTAIPLLVMAAAACGPDAPRRGIVFDEPVPAGALALTRFTGEPFDIAALRDTVVLVYFGYTHCPDVCPTTLSDWAGARRALGDRADRVRFVFVTVDPLRDTKEVAHGYALQFDSSFVGLSGTPEEIKAIGEAWHFAAYPEGDTRSRDYSVAHPAYTYLVDRRGRLRVLYEPGVRSEDLAAEIREFL